MSALGGVCATPLSVKMEGDLRHQIFHRFPRCRLVQGQFKGGKLDLGGVSMLKGIRNSYLAAYDIDAAEEKTHFPLLWLMHECTPKEHLKVASIGDRYIKRYSF